MHKKIAIACTVLIGVAAIWFYITTIHQHLSLESLQFYRDTFFTYSQLHPLWSRFLFGMSFFVLVAGFFPAAALLNLLGGFLFGVFEGFVIGMVASIAGSIVNFLSVRYVIGKPLQRKCNTTFTKFNAAFKKNGVSYLLSVRFAAIFPFPIMNMLLGLTEVSLWDYTWTTFVGIIPGSLLFVFMGKQLGTINSLGDVFTWPVLGGFLLLTLIALLPALRKRPSHS